MVDKSVKVSAEDYDSILKISKEEDRTIRSIVRRAVNLYNSYRENKKENLNGASKRKT